MMFVLGETKQVYPGVVRFILILWLALAFSVVLPAHGAASPDDDFYAHTTNAVEVLQQWYGKNGLWNSTGWWNSAICLEAVENVVVASNGGQYLDVIRTTFDRNAAGHFHNEFYDDEGWWALAWIRAFDLTGNPRYLKMTKTIFTDMKGGWDNHCGGGILWKKNHSYKNAIANELFLLVAIRLHQRTPADAGPGSYLDWAQREWSWFKQSGMINACNLVNDGLSRDCENNDGTTWTYNQGVIIGGLTDLYKTTGDTNYLKQADAIAAAAMAKLVDGNGILQEPCEDEGCNGPDVPQFKGIFIHYLTYLYDETHNHIYYDFLVKNACSTWANDRDEANHLGLKWSGPFDSADAARQSSAIMAVSALAKPVTQNPTFAEGAGNRIAANLVHDIGRPDGLNCWEADPVRNQVSGCLTKESTAKGLATGYYSARFELKVDNFNWDKSAVATLSVADAETGKIIASHTVTRSQFPNTLYHAFTLNFIAAAGRRYDFLTYWHYSPHAPRLTESSVVVQESSAMNTK
jgi:predicted alpha-1,6-mannanase (GH76 family)